jgi:phospholipase/carboxylesterase
MMSDKLKLFDYTHLDNKADRTCFLLHGTGGTKEDFLFLDEYLGDTYNLVGLQGNCDEHGYARFFRRLAAGVFDQESIRTESQKLYEFIKAWCDTYATTINKLCFLGYSNGANILLATVFYYPEVLKNLVLMHPMLPFKIEAGSLNLSLHHMFISNGADDSMVSAAQQLELVQLLKSCQARVSARTYLSGHEIHPQEITDAVTFIRTL